MKPKLALLLLAVAAASPASAEPLTTETIVALASSGIGDEAIVAKISSSGSRFDLTADQMIALKNRGVSGRVIAAMLNPGGGSAAPKLSMDSPDPMALHPAGVYLLSGDAAEAKMVRIDATVSNQAKTGGIFGYALTGGIASMSVKASIQNSSARVRTTNGRPVFYFFFDESNAGGAAQAGTWLSGTAATVTSPSEFTLITLTAKDGRREARVGSFNIGGAKMGVMDKDRIAFDYQLVRPGVFRGSPSQPLARGEYGFIYAVAGGGAGGAMTARIFDFAVQ